MPLNGQATKARVKLGKTPDDCWEYLGPVTPDGHGKITFCGKQLMARRWLWEQLLGPIPDGLVVYSTCGQKTCMNPHHWACGSQAEANRGSIQTKLLPSDVAAIRAARKDATMHTAAHLAQRYDVDATTIRDIWRGASWKRRGAPNYGPKKHAREVKDATI